MGEHSIGFRVKFDAIEPGDIRQMLTEYLEKFDRYEIKVTDELISSGKIKILLRISEELAKGRYSIHLPKNMLANSESYRDGLNMIHILDHYHPLDMVYLITHCPFIDLKECVDRILDISNRIPKNFMLLLENEHQTSRNYQYISLMNDLCGILQEKGIANVGVCLDLGHFLFGLHKESISEEQGILMISKMQNILTALKELHIHDYKNQDHLKIKKGLMSLKTVASFIKCHNLEVPIILEVTIDTTEEGELQVLIIREYLD